MYALQHESARLKADSGSQGIIQGGGGGGGVAKRQAQLVEAIYAQPIGDHIQIVQQNTGWFLGSTRPRMRSRKQ